MKSAKNKTIDISLTDGQEYLERCISVNRKTEVKNILNKTIIGDSLKVMEKLPRSFVDLLIVDPPYNLNKDYHGNKFNQTNNEEYEQYTTAWIE